MAKKETKSRSRKRDGALVEIGKKAKSGYEVRFGSVTVNGPKPKAAMVKEQVVRSAAALDRVTRSLTQPGVVLRPKKDVPHYFADDNLPGVLVRRLNGRTERGHL